MRIVKFENGMYGIRTRWAFGWHFLDLVNPRFEWRRGANHFFDCLSADIEVVKSIFEKRDIRKYTFYEE